MFLDPVNSDLELRAGAMRNSELAYKAKRTYVIMLIDVLIAGIHLEKDMSVPFGHTVATTVCLFEKMCARN